MLFCIISCSFPDLSHAHCQQGAEKKRDELCENIPEDDHVEGLKFLAERDMRSLHKVLGFCFRIFLLTQAIPFSTYLHLVGGMFRCRVFGNIFILREVGGGLWCSAGKLDKS